MELESEGGSSGESNGFSDGTKLFRSRLRFHAQMAPSLPPEYLRSGQHKGSDEIPPFHRCRPSQVANLQNGLIAIYGKAVHS